MEVCVSDKHSSLLQYASNYDCISFVEQAPERYWLYMFMLTASKLILPFLFATADVTNDKAQCGQYYKTFYSNSNGLFTLANFTRDFALS
jgi:hypothetical protein